MQITSATSPKTAYASPSDPAAIAAATPRKTVLGQDDFLKLLAVQFQAQDPMKPMEDTAFIAQMAQFTALDQSKSLLAQMTQLSTSQDSVTANSYIGRHVTFNAGNDKTVSGDVTGVDLTDGTPRLILGDQTYPLSAVLLVEPASPSTTPTAVPTNP
jgi:flagellar basal-body rod modification protein FlgD